MMHQPLYSDNGLSSKLGKLIRRLSSENDNEVVATVRAIERTLKSATNDLHDLADLVERYGTFVFDKASTQVVRTAAPYWSKAAPETKKKPAPRWSKMSAKNRLAWLNELSKDQLLACGGLPHAGYVGKFRAYLKRLTENGEPLNKNEINLINRWIGAYWLRWGKCP